MGPSTIANAPVSDRRRLLLVLPYFAPHVGGVEQFAEQLARALVSTGRWQVHVITSGSRGWGASTREEQGITVTRLGYWFRFSYTPVSLAWPLQIRRAIRRLRPDVINAHSPVPFMADCAVLVAGTVPVLLTYHAATLKKDAGPVFEIVRRIYGSLQAAVFRRCAAVLAVSDYVRDSLEPSVAGRLVTFSNALTAEAFLPEVPPPEQAPFLFMARLNREHSWKGLEEILRSLPDAPGASLVVAGDGDMRATYEALAEELKVAERVKFLGNVKGQAKMDALLGCQALIAYPTTSNDAFPTVLLEAWAASRAVVVAGIGPLPSLVVDQITGLVVPPSRPDALAAVLEGLRSDPDAAWRMGRAGRASVADLTWDKQAVRFEDLVADAIESRL